MLRSITKKMLFLFTVIFLLTIIIFFWFYRPVLKPLDSATKNIIKGGGLPPGCTCHSKNPSYQSMHELFSVEDCRKCHQKKENLMEKKNTGVTAEEHKILQKKMNKEPICQNCHQGGKIVRPKKKEISGSWFCPKEQKTYKKKQIKEINGKHPCPEDKTELIDVDVIALKSAKEPKNEYCILCHPLIDGLHKKHQEILATPGISPITDCLKCHQSHSQCGGCHF